MKVITISGYKPHELGIFQENHPGVRYIKTALKKSILRFIDEGLEWVLISGQLGVELWAGEVVIDLTLDHPQLKLGVLTPFLEQESLWKEDKQEYYQFILSQADFVDSITKRPYENPWQFRSKNKFLVEKSDGLIVMFDDEKQGSPQYLLKEAQKKAEKVNYEIVIITPYDIQLIIEEEQLENPENWSQ